MSHQLTPEQLAAFNREKGISTIILGAFMLLLAAGYFFIAQYYQAHPPHRVKAIWYLFHGILGTVGGTVVIALIGAVILGRGIALLKN